EIDLNIESDTSEENLLDEANSNPNTNNNSNTSGNGVSVTWTKVSDTLNQKMSYEEALRVYSTRRIQFDGVCNPTPAMSTYKNGTEIMIDNRASVARTLTLGSLGL